MTFIRIIKKFGMILSNHQRLRIFELGILMAAGGLLETCSVSLMLPFMEAAMNPDEIMNKWYIIMACDFFGINSPRTFLICLAAFLAVLYILKNIYLIFEYSIQYRFVYGNMFALQSKLLDIFVHRPYEFFLSANSGEILRIITTDTTNAFNLLVTMLLLFAELIVSVMLIMAIFMITPIVTVCIAGLLLIMLFLIAVIIKPILRGAGLSQQKAGAGMNKWLLQSIQGIKEIKVTQKEGFFQENYDRNGQAYVQSLRWSQTLGMTPRFIIEGVCMGATFIAVSVFIYQGYELDAMLPVLTAVAMAAIRLLPSVNRISSAMSAVAYGEPMLDKVIETIQTLNKNEDMPEIEALEGNRKSRAAEKVRQTGGFICPKTIRLNKVVYCYPGGEKNVLEGASMTVHRGESIGIIGASGAGKTTAVDLLLGLLEPQNGEILVDGVNMKENISGWLQQIGYIPQTIFMMDGTIRSNVAFGEHKDEVSDDAVWKALKDAAIDDFVKELPDGLDTEIGERGIRLSGGQRQRIGIARTLYHNPEILIFDEATSALDNETEAAIIDSIHKLQGYKTMFIIAHRLTTIEKCDHIFCVKDGRIIQER